MRPTSTPPIVGRLDIQLLRSFVAVSEAPTISKAADALNLSQPTLSLQMKRLEERAGRSLFEPSKQGRSRRLSRHGKRLVKYAQRIISAYNDAVHYLSYPELAGEIRLGVPEWFAGSGLNAILASFNEMHDNVQLRIIAGPSDRLRGLIRDNELDVSISIVDDSLAPIGDVWYEPLHWVSSRDGRCLDRDPLPVGLFSDPCPFRAHVRKHLEKNGRRWREEYVSESVATIRTAVAAGLAVTALPRGAITDEIMIIDDLPGFDALPPVKLGVYRSEASKEQAHLDDLVHHLSNFIESKMQSYRRTEPFDNRTGIPVKDMSNTREVKHPNPDNIHFLAEDG